MSQGASWQTASLCRIYQLHCFSLHLFIFKMVSSVNIICITCPFEEASSTWEPCLYSHFLPTKSSISLPLSVLTEVDHLMAILAPELASHGPPGGCSVVSVDPVGLAAATSGYWVSAGGQIDRSTR